jgi:DNA-directed RNA polymerase subunit RPC12/RpoP
MLLACNNCGAPLDIKEGERTSKCRYCKATSRTDALKTVAPTTPPDW